MLNIYSSSRYKINRKLIKQEVDSVLAEYPINKHDALNIVFVGRNKMKEIAQKYKNEDVALPVLSFSYRDEPESNEKVFGEVFICYPQAVLLAAERGKTVDTILLFLIRHGIENLVK